MRENDGDEEKEGVKGVFNDAVTVFDDAHFYSKNYSLVIWEEKLATEDNPIILEKAQQAVRITILYA